MSKGSRFPPQGFGGASPIQEQIFRVSDPDGYIGTHPSVYMVDAQPDKTVKIGVEIAADLEPSAIQLLIIPTATGNIRWSANYNYGALGTEAYNATAGAIAATTTAVVNGILTPITLTIPGIDAGDILGIEFIGDLDNAINTASYHVLGVRVS